MLFLGQNAQSAQCKVQWHISKQLIAQKLATCGVVAHPVVQMKANRLFFLFVGGCCHAVKLWQLTCFGSLAYLQSVAEFGLAVHASTVSPLAVTLGMAHQVTL